MNISFNNITENEKEELEKFIKFVSIREEGMDILKSIIFHLFKYCEMCISFILFTLKLVNKKFMQK